jgi:hypothetical protein
MWNKMEGLLRGWMGRRETFITQLISLVKSSRASLEINLSMLWRKNILNAAGKDRPGTKRNE